MHLGGHLNMTHVDEGALLWLQSRGVKTLLDVGCSVGGQVSCAVKLGMDAWGLEGDYSLLQSGLIEEPSRVLFTDFTKTWAQMPVQFDAIWCVEVAEHIEERYLPNLLKTFRNNLKEGGTLVFTANDGPGMNHVNLKPIFWWKAVLCDSELEFSPDLTKELVTASTMQREFIKNTGMVFTRAET
jgi:2-polyprenyl-3-methyl-5-hydroxy-6-metoxy-1,4-benzoquinol methylase